MTDDRDSAQASRSSADPAGVLELRTDVVARIVQTQATCPFIGTAIATGVLPVRNASDNPLASVDDVRALGNTGGGDLGDLLQLFATGNHLRMRGKSAKLDTRTPPGLFSLDFPGSQGSHAGHSGILESDPHALGSGRLSADDFNRLAARARNGVIARRDVGRFIAENLHRDANSKVGTSATASLLGDLETLVGTLGPTLVSKLTGSKQDAADAHRELEEKLTRLLGADNLVGSSGEFGLLFAFLVNKPGAPLVDGEPALDVRDVEAMFVRKQFPEGWQTWKKTRADWVKNTTALLVSAGAEYLRLRKQKR